MYFWKIREVPRVTNVILRPALETSSPYSTLPMRLQRKSQRDARRHKETRLLSVENETVGGLVEFLRLLNRRSIISITI